MAWIRFDCSALSDELLIDKLTAAEFKAWTLFLLRVKAEGARGSVKVTSGCMLERLWNLPAGTLDSMLAKIDGRIYEAGGRWYVRNWAKYQDDHQLKTASSGNSGDAANGTTPPHTTPQDTTPQDKQQQQQQADAAAGLESAMYDRIGWKKRLSRLDWDKVLELKRKHGPVKFKDALDRLHGGVTNVPAYLKAVLEPEDQSAKDRRRLEEEVEAKRRALAKPH